MNVTIESIEEAHERLKGIIRDTPLEYSKRLSEKYKANIYLKREDLQEVRSFKIRGAFNKIASLSDEEKTRGIVCASAGNHAQGVAFSCFYLQISGTIFMPDTTPRQKVKKVRNFGGENVEIILTGETFDDSFAQAENLKKEKNAIFVHPFNDELVISGQGTVGKEIFDELGEKVDFVFSSVGGGGLAAGCMTYLKEKIRHLHFIGVEPAGAPAMYESLKTNRVVTLSQIDTFVDGAAVRRIGEKNFEIYKNYAGEVITVPEGKVCTTMIELYQNEGIVTEPAGALSVAALDFVAYRLRGKNVVCIISGGNNDILRYPEIMERSLRYEGLKHYFIINFTQKPGQLKKFVEEVLGPNDDIVRFEYIKKTNAEKGPAFIGIELSDKDDYQPLLNKLNEMNFDFRVVSDDDLFYKHLV
ncbi:MAG: threonine ammonia-lyase IlvA [Leptospiraceae bacterium]|nr:threonine ammonia-lyase IlvA [Leptospiraceae bacterium]MCP5495742.1 threonine ammonia-lyase IlvA [Leptospiraceae bacterium]